MVFVDLVFLFLASRLRFLTLLLKIVPAGRCSIKLRECQAHLRVKVIADSQGTAEKLLGRKRANHPKSFSGSIANTYS